MDQLHRIIAMRNCGLTLAEIGEVLSAHADSGLADLLRRQLGSIDGRIRQAVALRGQLVEVLGALAGTEEPSTTEILRLIEETNTMNQPLTAEKFAELGQARANQLREMSGREFEALKRKMKETWAALNEAEQHALIEQRRAVLPIGSPPLGA